MNKRIEKIRDDIRLTENKIRELQEHLKSLRIREKQMCDEELIRVMRSVAGRDKDVMALLDEFTEMQGEEESEDTAVNDEKGFSNNKWPEDNSDQEEDKEDIDEE